MLPAVTYEVVLPSLSQLRNRLAAPLLPELGRYSHYLVCSPAFPFLACDRTLKSALEKSLPDQSKELNTLQGEHSKYMNAARSEFQGL